MYKTKEKNRGRIEERIISVYDNLKGIDRDWIGLKSLIKVKRKVKKKGIITQETSYFISSLSAMTSAKIFHEGIRSHWSIETFHYIKDVVFKEDNSKVKKGNAPENYSLMRSIIINMFRNKEMNKMQEAIEKCANNVEFMMEILEG